MLFFFSFSDLFNGDCVFIFNFVGCFFNVYLGNLEIIIIFVKLNYRSLFFQNEGMDDISLVFFISFLREG